FYVPHFSPMIIKLDENFGSDCYETDYTAFTYQENMPVKVKTPVVESGSGGSLINTTVEAAFIMSDTVLCSAFSDSCALFTSTTLQQQSVSFPVIYPNPAEEQIAITLFSERKENVRITIFNSQGQIVQALTEILNHGSNTLVFDVKDLPAGIFIARINGIGYSTAVRFLKQ
ncbi:MAG TPA: T9SS type A sorting domain-containing protein, partial [Chitinophagales bacterium]|nr:T9SS type A sorting domain-containing protein [Chitinophagales bacterium]